MQLTAREFAKLIKELRCDARPSERRANPRAPMRSQLEVIPVTVDPAARRGVLVRVRDISRTGLGLVAITNLADARRLLLLLPKDANETFVLLCEAVRVTRLTGDLFSVGVRMVRRVTSEELARFIAGSPESFVELMAPVEDPFATAPESTTTDGPDVAAAA